MSVSRKMHLSRVAALLAAAVLAPIPAPAEAPAPVQAEALPAEPLPDANVFMQGMAETQKEYERALDDYTYDVSETEDRLDRQRRVKSTRTRGYEVFRVAGTDIWRLVAEDGRPLPSNKLKKEDERVAKEARKAARKREREGKDDDEIRLSTILERFDFRSVARETRDGRPTLVVDVTPRPGKRDIEGDNVLRTLTGRLWVDEESRAVVAARLRNNAGIKFLLGVGASLSELEFILEFQKVDDVWLPRRTEIYVKAKLLVFKGYHMRIVHTYSRYRRFEVSSEEDLRPVS